MEMTPKLLRDICRSLDLYQTPELNDKLYLHYKSFTAIQNLEPYTHLKVLYLEGNALSSLSGLDGQRDLRCLYVQENRLEALDSLAALPELSTLNLSQNFIEQLGNEPLSARWPQLHTLQLKGNRLSHVQGLEAIRAHPTLSVLDLANNQFDQPGQAAGAAVEGCPVFDALLALLQSLPSLRVLYLSPCPLLQSLSNYRKRVLAFLPGLTYLDERPVFEEERRLVSAWARAGLQGEREERDKMRREEQAKTQRQSEWFDAMIKEGRASRVQEEKEQLAFPSPAPAAADDDDDDEKRPHVPEHRAEELTLDRETLAETEPTPSNIRAALKAWEAEKSPAQPSAATKPIHSLLTLEERKPAQRRALIEVIDDLDA